jgi:mono/diheme cytochrome c family protein
MANHIAAMRVASCLVAVGVLSIGMSLLAQEQKPAPQVKNVSAQPIASIEGRDNFAAYCAVCHGQDGKGNGPAAPAMKVTVPDLTTIAQRNQGHFSATNVEQVIRGTGKTTTPAHGVTDMPIWGNVFMQEDRARLMLRIGNLVKYVETIQVPGK